MPTLDIATIIRCAVEELWNTGNLDVADQCFTATYVNHGGVIPDLIPGPEIVKLTVVVARRAFPGLRVAIDNLVVEGPLAEVRWTAIAGPTLCAFGTTGRLPSARLSGVTFARCTAGQIAESWTRFDVDGDLATVGPAPSARFAA